MLYSNFSNESYPHNFAGFNIDLKMVIPEFFPWMKESSFYVGTRRQSTNTIAFSQIAGATREG